MKKGLGVFLLFIILTYCPAAARASWDFTTIPVNGLVSGPAGATLIWDYLIVNNDTNYWLVITSLGVDVFQHGLPNDVFDYPILQPSTSLSNTLYEFTWDTSAPVGFTNSGLFTLSAEFWNGDPFNGGTYFALAEDHSAFYTVTVSANSVPLPPSLILIASGLVGIGYLRKFYK